MTGDTAQGERMRGDKQELPDRLWNEIKDAINGVLDKYHRAEREAITELMWEAFGESRAVVDEVDDDAHRYRIDSVRCMHCGHVFPIGTELASIPEHDEACPSHPAVKRAEAAEAEVARLRGWFGREDKW